MRGKKLFFWMAIPIILELFIFNYRFWVTHTLFVLRGTNIEEYNIQDIYAHWGLEPKGSDSFIVTDATVCHFEIQDIDLPVSSVFLDFSRVSDDVDVGGDRIQCGVYLKDEGNAFYYRVPDEESSYDLIPTVGQTKWFHVEPYGRMRGLKVVLENIKEGDVIQYRTISLNRPCPMFFSVFRVILLWIMEGIVWACRKESVFRRKRFCEAAAQRKWMTVGIVLITAVMFFIIEQAASHYTAYNENMQYAQLARALSEKHFYLEEKPPAWLLQMDNPYDPQLRWELYQESGEGYLYDCAFFGGKYYVYFGIVPVFLYYLPYFLVTGKNLSNYLPVFLSCVITLFGTARLLKTIIIKWFQDISCWTYILLLITGINCYGALILVSRPDVYETAISTGAMFAIWGIDMWLEAVDKCGAVTSYTKLAFGSFLFALVVGCRPPMFLAVVPFLPFFARQMKKEESFAKRRKFILSFLIPFIPMAFFQMYYNYARFGSIFDFGANYNLTFNDMTKRGFRIGRTGQCIFEYLLRPVYIQAVFPYIQNVKAQTTYMGITKAETIFGGAFALCPLLLFGFLCFHKKLNKCDGSVRIFSRCSFITAVLLVILDGNVAGITMRYHADFTVLLFITAVVVICEIETKWEILKAGYLYHYQNFIFVLAANGIFFHYLTIFLHDEFSAKDYMTEMYYTIQHTIEFWH